MVKHAPDDAHEIGFRRPRDAKQRHRSARRSETRVAVDDLDMPTARAGPIQQPRSFSVHVRMQAIDVVGPVGGVQPRMFVRVLGSGIEPK